MDKRFETPVIAETIRRLLDRWALGEDPDPWLEFPQNMCCYCFGEDKKAIPIGSLKILWGKDPNFRLQCPDCGATCYAVAFGGLIHIGAFMFVCIGCDFFWYQDASGLVGIGQLLGKSPLRQTEFRSTGGRLGSSFASDGAELLKELGISEPAENLGQLLRIR